MDGHYKSAMKSTLFEHYDNLLLSHTTVKVPFRLISTEQRKRDTPLKL